MVACCVHKKPESSAPDPFPVGTEVMFQPDSTHGVVARDCSCSGDKYTVRYKDNTGTFKEIMLTGSELQRINDIE